MLSSDIYSVYTNTHCTTPVHLWLYAIVLSAYYVAAAQCKHGLLWEISHTAVYRVHKEQWKTNPPPTPLINVIQVACFALGGHIKHLKA